MKSSSLCLAGAAMVAIGTAGYYVATQPAGGALLMTLAVHGFAATLCALAGAAATAGSTAPGVSPKASGQLRVRVALFVFYIVPALLLPVGGVITVWAMTLILRSTPGSPREDASPFESLSSPSILSPKPLIAEPVSGAMRQWSLKEIRAVATGLRDVRPVRLAAAVLQHLQQHDDTEVRFRAQGAVTRAIRRSEEWLKQLADQETLTVEQKIAASDACSDLADWTSATGANRQALLESAIGYLDGETSASIPRLARLARAQLAAGRTDGAADTIVSLQGAGASEDLSGPLEAELLFQQRNWSALVEHCASLPVTHSELSAVGRFWRAAHAPG